MKTQKYGHTFGTVLVMNISINACCRLIIRNHDFQERVFLLCATDSSLTLFFSPALNNEIILEQL